MRRQAETGEEIEIGSVRPDELDGMCALMCAAFHLPYAEAREIFYADPYFDIANKRVLRVNGQMVSCLTLIDTACWIGEGVVRLGGIAGVATLPEMRGRGYAGRLLTETARTLYERGYALSALFPFSYPYYRKFGWELSGFAHRYLTAPANLPLYPEARHVRLAREDDLPQLERLYNRAAHGQTLRCLRDAKRWLYIFDRVKQRVVYAKPAEKVEGYLLYEYRAGGAEQAGAASNVSSPPVLRVLEMTAGSTAARRGLAGYLAAQRTVGCIEYTSAWDDLAENGLLQMATGTVTESVAQTSVETFPAIMARVIHLERALESLASNWLGFCGTLALTLHDDLLSHSTVLITGDGSDTPTIRTAAATETFLDSIEGDVRAWSQVLVGHFSAGDACVLGLLQASTPHALTLAAPLFPRRAPFLPAPDHF